MTRDKQQGITLLELLLVITIMAIIIISSVRYYERYQQQTELALIKQDIQTIREALNKYFHTIGCDSSGVFPPPASHPSLAQLQVNVHPSAIVTNYSASIVDSGQMTQADKPIYYLQITAQLDPHYSPALWQWYAQQWSARLSGNTLTWTTLPTSSLATGQSGLWILDGERRVFRNAEGAYCAY